MVKVIDKDNITGLRILTAVAYVTGAFGVALLYAGIEAFIFKGLWRYGGWYAGISAVGTSAYFITQVETVLLNRLYIAYQLGTLYFQQR